MARDESMLFDRGNYYVDGVTRADLEGQEVEIEDIDHSVTDAKTLRSGKRVRLRMVRNVTGSALAAKRVVKAYVGGTGSEFMGQVDDYATAATDPVMGVVDEWLGSTTVPDDALFWIVVRGPSKVTTGASGDTNIACGKYVIPTTGGKVVEQLTTAGSNASGDIDTAQANIQGRVGRLCAAVNATDTDVLCDVNLG